MSYLEEGAISPCRNLRLRAESFQVDHLRSHEYPVIAHSVKGDARCALSVVCSWSPFIRFDGSDLSLLASPLHMVLSKPDLRVTSRFTQRHMMILTLFEEPVVIAFEHALEPRRRVCGIRNGVRDTIYRGRFPKRRRLYHGWRARFMYACCRNALHVGIT